jgi:tetraacyldisaccharide 4'-kinase
VAPGADPRRCGDEPVLLAQRSGCPVWIGADRAAAARALLTAHPACDVLLSDDGLQHYRLARDVEIAVIDAERGLGNGWLLPAGPLREPASRLDEVDAVVVHGETPGGVAPRPARCRMRLHGAEFHNLLNPGHRVGPGHFRHARLHAIAGIGNPARFFRHLQQLGLAFAAHPFPDHHPFTAADLAFDDADAILMTEKDAVKCRPYANEKCWALRVDAAVDAALGRLVLDKLDRPA